jgi:hypothetical protein
MELQLPQGFTSMILIGLMTSVNVLYRFGFTSRAKQLQWHPYPSLFFPMALADHAWVTVIWGATGQAMDLQAYTCSTLAVTAQSGLAIPLI